MKLQNFKKFLVALSLGLMSAGAMAADLDASSLTAGITEAKPVIIAVGTAIFGLVGLLVAIRYAKRAAS
ncbi:MAG: hypothetical protein IJV56_10640 [Neisseriaceae bacterium]|nr:hypothetical protein [Neisseriaceae bacterium]MBQ9725772.1 hypothetical protein [Neisseriaceae bacterium]MBR1819507.1 hypothetical protein [Neisseriaceae bacterium]